MQAVETLDHDALKVIKDEGHLREEIGDDLGEGIRRMGARFLGGTLSDGGGWHQEAEETMIDNEANVPGINHEFRVWCVRHQSGQIEIFGRVQSVEQFHEMMRALYNEFSRTLSEDKSSAI